MNHCIRHFEEPVAGVCRTCQHTFCDRCLVYSFGPKKAPFCVGCALDASGVRSPKRTGRAPAPVAMKAGGPDIASSPGGLDRRTARAERRAAKADARSTRRNRGNEPEPVVVADQAPSDTFVPVPGQLVDHRYQPAALDQFV